MSKISNIPGQEDPRSIKNEKLLPSIFNTSINQKMLDSSLNLMTSKGKMLPFYNSYGTQNATKVDGKFLETDSDPVRSESQTNLAVTFYNDDLEYQGKTSYIDIENYFKVKGLPLKDGTDIDDEVKALQWPLNQYRLTDYQMYYWLPMKLAPFRIHVEDQGTGIRLNVSAQIVGKPYAIVTDDTSGKKVNLASYQRIFFTGAVDSTYASPDPEQPIIYVVLGVGTSIILLKESTFEVRTNTTTQVKIPWDEDSGQPPYMGKEWSASPWDSSRLLNLDPEYVLIEQYDTSRTPWSIINNWYHIARIREVCDFYDLKIEDYANENNRAKRPIIQLQSGVKLFNWPTTWLGEVATALPGNTNKYSGIVLENLKDKNGWTIPEGSLVVFAENRYVQRLDSVILDGNKVSKWTQTNLRAVNESGVFIVGSPALKYYSFIFKNNKWQPAQNKTTPNQCPLIELYDADGISYANDSVYYNSRFTGAKVLDFKEGPTYDPVLQRNILLSNIEFDALPDVSDVLLSGPNQLQFYSDIDNVWVYDIDINEKLTSGINYYLYGSRLSSFWNVRSGLDTTMPEQVVEFNENTDNVFTADIYSPVDGFNEIHVYENIYGEVGFYYQLKDYGVVQYTSTRQSSLKELLLPVLLSDLYTEYKIVCHNLSSPFELYENKIVDGYSAPVLLDEPVVTNNGISNGVITVNLDSTYVNENLEVIKNPVAFDNAKFLWKFKNSYRIGMTRSIEKFKFITSAFLRDRTVQLYSDYDFRNATDSFTETGLTTIEALSGLNKKAKTGDKIIIESPAFAKNKKTAPYSLTSNPANESLGTLDYYSLYQHQTHEQGSAPNGREFLDPQNKDFNLTSALGSGTIHKHNQPIGLFALLANNAELDLVETINKQAKHYDTFMSRFKSDLQNVVNRSGDISSSNWQELITIAIESIYVNQVEETFWHHSNMIGWGIDYKEKSITATTTNAFASPIESISHGAGKESLTHLIVDGKVLQRGNDYEYSSNITGYYTGVKFASHIIGKTVIIRQWPTTFSSRVPASLAKLGLSAIYMPEVYRDETYNEPTYFLIRHDGTRYLLEDGVDENLTPNNIVDALLFEYEKMVFSSISYDVENLKHRLYLERYPGYFRQTRQSYQDVVNLTNNAFVAWQIENSIFVLDNKTYDTANKFTYRYELAELGIKGSWRAVYKYLFDTDRPHTHPWEMLGYTLKPADWDNKFSWTDPVKRTALISALRTGLRGQTPNVFFARSLNNVDDENMFPVDQAGKLLSPLELSWISEKITNLEFDSDFAAGELSPQELVFKSTHKGLANEVIAKYLLRPLAFVNYLWRPGSLTTKNNFGIRTSSQSSGWNQSSIDDVYHRSTSDCFTSGIEALLAEHYVLQNKDFYTDIVSKSRNKKIVKEFLLSGFTNKNNLRIQSTSINSQRQALYIPEENYSVRTISHYKNKEYFYSGMRIIWTGKGWMIYGFVTESPYFSSYRPSATSRILPVTIGTFVAREKENYDKVVVTVPYGYVFTNKQELYDFIKGYGLYLEDTGFVFDRIEDNDIKNWQLSAKQFAFWTEDPLLPGNYIDLNPCADELRIALGLGQLDDLMGSNKNPGHCVTRNNKPLFAKDLIVFRDSITSVKTKDSNNPIYGIKFTTSVFETVIHLDGVSVFKDIYFLPDQRLSKRSFLITGKKTPDWTGRLYAPGYYFHNNDMNVNLDNIADQGKNLLAVEDTSIDTQLINAAKSQFGLDKNPELRQLFLTDESELLFKNSIPFVKGTRKVFTSLEPLTHSNDSSTVPFEEYLVKLGEIGNTKNINFYEFQLRKSDIINEKQIVNFDTTYSFDNSVAHNVPSKDWVFKPQNESSIEFTTTLKQNKFMTTGPVANYDTNYNVQNVDDVDFLYDEFKPLWTIPGFSSTTSYKAGDMVRISSPNANSSIRGKVFVFRSSQGPGLLENRLEYMQPIAEPYLPNIFVSDYPVPNSQLADSKIYPPASWQILQTVDNNVVIKECCPGPTDVSRTLIETTVDHNLTTGEKVLVVNTEEDWGSVNGIWTIEKVDSKSFYIPTRLTQKIPKGKIFTFKPVRFSTVADLQAAINNQNGYNWNNKLSTVESSLGIAPLNPQPTPSGYSQIKPLVVVDQVVADPEQNVSWDTGGYVSYQINIAANGSKSLTEVKREELPVIANDIEQVVIYDYGTSTLVAKVELFDPSRLVIPSTFLNELDVVKRVDPARYNRTSSQFKAVYSSTAWFSEQVGKRWWDTSTVKFTDYKVGSAVERSLKWGEMMDGSTVDIYEWIESPVHPSQWQEYVAKGSSVNGILASGTPYMEIINGTPTYNWTEEENYINGKTVKVFYFWVKNKSTIKENSGRMLSPLQISKSILNPSAAGIPWCAPLTKNTMMFVGIENLLTDNTVVQIKRKSIGTEKHHQWMFIADYNSSQTIPEYLHVRFRDSLAEAIFDEKYYGAPYNKIMYLERNVPDKRLHPFNKLGNLIRPYAQSWFKDLYEARRSFLKEANLILKNIDVVNSIAGWDNHLHDQVPIGEEKVDVTEMWHYVDYESPLYDKTKSIKLIVESEEQALQQSVSMSDGEYIKVVNTLLQSEVIYQIIGSEGIVPIWRKNGTIAFTELTREMYLKRSWDGAPWDYYPWDNPWSLLFHCIVEALRRDIFVGNYQKYYNKIMCIMFRHVLSEQSHVDWLAKASTIQPYNLIGADLEQKVELERDSSSTLISYFKNVKSFRDKLRDSVITKQIQEPMDILLTDTHQLNITLRYNRHDIGEEITNTNVRGAEFVNIGWDDEQVTWDLKNWDPNQYDNNDQIQKIYSGLSGIPAEEIATILQGPTYSRFKSKSGVGQELVNCYIGESNVIFDVDHYFDSLEASIKIRTFYHKLAVRHLMLLNSKSAMLNENIDAYSTSINLSAEDLAKLPDASFDAPAAVWIDNERIEYCLKTELGISKLIRATAGTSMQDHTMGTRIYPETGETVLPAKVHFSETSGLGPYFSDPGKSLDLSSNSIVAILKSSLEY